eukprot:1850672-Rhodomonas_salina.4
MKDGCRNALVTVPSYPTIVIKSLFPLANPSFSFAIPDPPSKQKLESGNRTMLVRMARIWICVLFAIACPLPSMQFSVSSLVGRQELRPHSPSVVHRPGLCGVTALSSPNDDDKKAMRRMQERLEKERVELGGAKMKSAVGSFRKNVQVQGNV